VVLEAGDADSASDGAAMSQLCRTYWYPLYAYLRRRGHSEHDAQDLTQGFLAQLLARGAIQKVDREKGRFRSFLLTSLNYFVSDERDRAAASKRGGGQKLVSLDAEEAENRYRLEPPDDRSPEKIFEYRWAIALLDEVLLRLEKEFAENGKTDLFEGLKPFLIDGTEGKTYAEVASEVGMTEEAVKKAVQRMRRRYRELFRETIAQTVATADEVEDELRHLCTVLGS
jgi:RNA polymerase sigma factor (sigma-70 family)